MRGKFYGIGVGPGDQELLTLKAVKIIGFCDGFVIPNAEGKDSTVFKIAKPYINKDAEILEVNFKMIRNKAERVHSRQLAAEKIIEKLEEGKTLAFLTLGDPSIYSTCMYVCSYLKERGYECEIIPGVPSFCAVAAKLLTSIAEEDENFTVLAMNESEEELEKAIRENDNLIFMKAAKKTDLIKKVLQKTGIEKTLSGVTKCGLEGEEVFFHFDQIREEELNYFTTLICKRKKESDWFQL